MNRKGLWAILLALCLLLFCASTALAESDDQEVVGVEVVEPVIEETTLTLGDTEESAYEEGTNPRSFGEIDDDIVAEPEKQWTASAAANETIVVFPEGEPVDVNYVRIEGIATTVEYTGEPIEFYPYLFYLGNEMIEGTDYTVEYLDNVNAGTGTVVITGIGDYTGEVRKTFNISKISQTLEIVPKANNDPDFAFTKLYDGTDVAPVSADDLTFWPPLPEGEEVIITSVEAHYLWSGYYNGYTADAGYRTVELICEIEQTKSTNYIYTLDKFPAYAPGRIEHRVLTVRPVGYKGEDASPEATLSKPYGAQEPYLSYEVDGLLPGDDLRSAISGYYLSREEGEDVGMYRISLGDVKGIGNYAEEPILEESWFEITKRSLEDEEVHLPGSDLGDEIYTGAPIEPEVYIYLESFVGSYHSKPLVQGVDYDLSYSDNIEIGSTATVTITGKGNYTGTFYASFFIRPAPLVVEDKSLKIDPIPDQIYTGDPIEPELGIYYYDIIQYADAEWPVIERVYLQELNNEYYANFYNNVKPGIAKVIVTCRKFSYEFERVETTFRIVESSASSDAGGVTASAVDTVPASTDVPLDASAVSNTASTPAVSTPAIPALTISAPANARTTVAVGASYQIDTAGSAAKAFKSSNKKIAVVSNTGLVTPRKAGKTKITFKVGKKKRTVTLTVKDPTVPSAVALNMSGTVAARVGEPQILTVMLPENTYSGIKWKSSNKKVATVKNGVVTFKKKGKVTITATATRGKKKAKVKFVVSK